MCFSAEASFSASVICCTIGIASLNRANKKYLMIAAIPLLFGIHQAIEGVVWLFKGKDIGYYSGLLFISIAFCFWPVYIPLTTVVTELKGIRKNVSIFLLIVGIFVSIYAAYLLTYPLIIDFSSHKIQYLTSKEGSKFVAYLYAIAVLVPLWLMRSIYIKFFGLVVFIFLGLSSIFFYPAQFSVWCFFSAVSSILIFLAVSSKNMPESIL